MLCQIKAIENPEGPFAPKNALAPSRAASRRASCRDSHVASKMAAAQPHYPAPSMKQDAFGAHLLFFDFSPSDFMS